MLVKSSFLVLILVFQTSWADIKVRVKLMSRPISGLQISGNALSIQESSDYKRVSLGVRQSLVLKALKKQENSYLWSYQQESSYKEKKVPFLLIRGERLKIQSLSVPDEVFLWPKNSNEVDVIAVLNLDEYLQGVVPSEMPLEWPEEALKAQAVLARSYVIHQMQKNKSRHYHVDSSVLDQKYTYALNWGLDQQRKLKSILANTHKEVLKNKSGQIVKTLYHADCGGQTVEASQVWGGDYTTLEVKDSQCPAPRNANWIYTVSKDTLRQKLLLKGHLKDIRVLLKTGIRPEEVEFKTHLETHKISPQVLRSALGYQNVKSAAFEIHMDSQNVIFKGKGFGHGVGLCQNGAKNLAKANKNYKEILKHYFPQYTLSSL